MTYTYKIEYQKLTEVTQVWVDCSYKTTNCAVIQHLKGLTELEDKGIVRNIRAYSIKNIIG